MSILLSIAVVTLLWSDVQCLDSFEQLEADDSEQDLVSVHPTHVLYPKKQLVKVLQSSILRKLNWTEPPTVTQPLPRLPSYLMQQFASTSKDESEHKSFVFPHNKIFACFVSNRWDCSRFQFEITLDDSNIKSVRVWFRKRAPTNHLSVSVYFDETMDVQEYDEFTSDVIVEKGWIGFALQKSALEEAGELLRCIIEVKGGAVYETGEDGPFLTVSKVPSTSGRQRRGVDSPTNPSCDCCVVDRHVSVEDLEWHNWILAPDVMNVRACKGTCHYDLSSFNLTYGHTMYKLMKNNISYAVDEFWVPHCFPTKMSDLKIIYLSNKTSELVETELKDFVIDSCSCLAPFCHKN